MHSLFLKSLQLLPAIFISTASAKINWSPCEAAPSLQCATLDVPFDYTSPNSTETLTLQLNKIPAPLGSKGSILANPGGPGQPGRQGIVGLASPLIALTGGEHDIISFDTRGTVNTIPFECTEDEIGQYEMYNEIIAGNSSEGTLGALWARGTINADLCAQNASKIGSVLTTAFVARDMIQIVDALEEDGLLRYWGFSYGTVLGATVASMFPDRMDKVILDGVMNPHEYYHAAANIEEWADSDAAFSDIFTHCVKAGPKLCPLAAHNKTAASLEQMTFQLLDRLKLRPTTIGPMIIDYPGLKGYIMGTVSGMQGWPVFTMLLDHLLFGVEYKDLEDILQSTSPVFSTDPDLREPTRKAFMALTGIHCSDNQVRAGSLAEFMPTARKLYSISRVAGDNSIGSYIGCQQWQIEPKETYRGPFIAETKTPVLLIGNTLDSHSPLRSAHNVSAGFEGSVVLEVNGNGHTSTNVPSLCVLEKTTAFWRDGTLPEEGTVCERDIEPFTGLWWDDILKDDAE
ncbi:uncharacterized protein APUU_30840A [Aspergillus puulaauensis]|uniref:Peptidase S33 tripeptidyl aminopeptidase-like C-terminal domain-containing protein n=1 Tax=Aspergillus puulaauensis TaxID=1220207 RepID=A0A7R8AME9_9EURO|nr:uncharacterized protein APUU_30840A [Aspergillus puulaauensis]BCS22615.1 hypothetical protein APUU_30840A [Aspergillus puulaauensis]